MAGLNRDVFRLNSVLKFHRGQENVYAASTSHAKILATSLPDWVKVGSRCCYVSKSSGGMHNVKIQKVDEKQQMVTVIFEQDSKCGKQIPFAECNKTGDGTLRPIWKPSQRIAPSDPTAGSPNAHSRSNIGSTGKTRQSQTVEDIASSDEESKPTKAPTGNSKAVASPAAFVPRAVALGGKVTVAAEPFGPMPQPGKPKAGVSNITSTEISDDEDSPVLNEVTMKARRRSRSLRRASAG